MLCMSRGFSSGTCTETFGCLCSSFLPPVQEHSAIYRAEACQKAAAQNEVMYNCCHKYLNLRVPNSNDQCTKQRGRSNQLASQHKSKAGPWQVGRVSHLAAAGDHDGPEHAEQLDADPDGEQDLQHQPHIVPCRLIQLHTHCVNAVRHLQPYMQHVAACGSQYVAASTLQPACGSQHCCGHSCFQLDKQYCMKW